MALTTGITQFNLANSNGGVCSFYIVFPAAANYGTGSYATITVNQFAGAAINSLTNAPAIYISTILPKPPPVIPTSSQNGVVWNSANQAVYTVNKTTGVNIGCTLEIVLAYYPAGTVGSMLGSAMAVTWGQGPITPLTDPTVGGSITMSFFSLQPTNQPPAAPTSLTVGVALTPGGGE